MPVHSFMLDRQTISAITRPSVCGVCVLELVPRIFVTWASYSSVVSRSHRGAILVVFFVAEERVQLIRTQDRRELVDKVSGKFRCTLFEAAGPQAAQEMPEHETQASAIDPFDNGPQRFTSLGREIAAEPVVDR